MTSKFYFFFIFVIYSQSLDISTFNYQLEHYEASSLYFYHYSDYHSNNFIDLYRKYIDPNFEICDNKFTTLNKIIDFFVVNKISNTLTRFVYKLTNNPIIEQFLDKKIDKNLDIESKDHENDVLVENDEEIKLKKQDNKIEILVEDIDKTENTFQKNKLDESTINNIDEDEKK